MVGDVALEMARARPALWSAISLHDDRARALSDRHYSRKRKERRTKQYLAPGERAGWMHEGPRGLAVWGVVRNLFRGVVRWRNTLFRNESGTLSSELVIEATVRTYDHWIATYGSLPPEPLTTEVDIEATRARRSRLSEPGKCYLEAGWTKAGERQPSHGRPATVYLRAPDAAAARALLAEQVRRTVFQNG